MDRVALYIEDHALFFHVFVCTLFARFTLFAMPAPQTSRRAACQIAPLSFTAASAPYGL
jgi:hypothetical protein